MCVASGSASVSLNEAYSVKRNVSYLGVPPILHLLRGALHVGLDFMAFTAGSMRPAGLFFVLKGFLFEQPRRLRLASGDTQLLRDTPRLDDLADLSASAVLSAG